MNKPTLRELALALELTTIQIRELLFLGGIPRTTRRRTIDAIKRLRMTLVVASEIWGFSNASRQLGKHVDNGRLELANPGKVYKRWKPRLVTVAAMLDLMRKTIHPASGFRVDV